MDGLDFLLNHIRYFGFRINVLIFTNTLSISIISELKIFIPFHP